MAKRRRRERREQHHLRQESTRRRSYTMGGASSQGERYQPGFPMNLLTNLKAFSIIGVLIAAIMVVSAVLFAQAPDAPAAGDLPTPTADDPDATPTPTPTEDPRRFSAADQVIDAETTDYRAILKTSEGDIVIDLFEDVAPNTVNSFVFLAQNKFFDGLTFHRVREGFVIQGGDPKGDGTGGPGYTTKDEPNEIRNTRGTVAMAKGTPDEFGSQFFINLKDNTALDFDSSASTKFYPFGEVVEGMDVVDAIAAVPVGPGSDGVASKPIDPVFINEVIIETSEK